MRRKIKKNLKFIKEILRIIFRLQKPEILMSEDEIKCLAGYAAKTKKIAVEIGTYKGGSAAVISKALPDKAKLFTIDPYIPDSKIPSFHGHVLIAYLNVLKYGNIRKVNFLRDISSNAAKSLTEPIDLLLIDGSHHYEDVKNDFIIWSKFVQPGGYILFHDSNRKDLSRDTEWSENGWCGPTLVCHEIKNQMIGHYEHVQSFKSINVFQKKFNPASGVCT